MLTNTNQTSAQHTLSVNLLAASTAILKNRQHAPEDVDGVHIYVNRCAQRVIAGVELRPLHHALRKRKEHEVSIILLEAHIKSQKKKRMSHT